MTGSVVSTVALWAVVASLMLTAGAVLLRMATGHIHLQGLLRPRPGAPFSFDRLQLVAVTLMFAGGYLVAALSKGPGDRLPGISPALLLILIGSHGTYLSAKVAVLRSAAQRGS